MGQPTCRNCRNFQPIKSTYERCHVLPPVRLYGSKRNPKVPTRCVLKEGHVGPHREWGGGQWKKGEE